MSVFLLQKSFFYVSPSVVVPWHLVGIRMRIRIFGSVPLSKGSGCGSVPLSNGSGCGSRRPKNLRVIKKSKTVEIKVFLTPFAWWCKDPDPYLWLTDPDPQHWFLRCFCDGRQELLDLSNILQFLHERCPNIRFYCPRFSTIRPNTGQALGVASDTVRRLSHRIVRLNVPRLKLQLVVTCYNSIPRTGTCIPKIRN